MTFKLAGLVVVAVTATLSASFTASAQQNEKPHKVAHSHHADRSTTAMRNDPNAVYYGGTYFGSDPDPRIRAEILRSAGASVGGR
jgi:hypothetical protein